MDEREDQIELLHAELRAYGSNSGQSGIPTKRDFDKISFAVAVKSRHHHHHHHHAPLSEARYSTSRPNADPRPSLLAPHPSPLTPHLSPLTPHPSPLTPRPYSTSRPNVSVPFRT